MACWLAVSILLFVVRVSILLFVVRVWLLGGSILLFLFKGVLALAPDKEKTRFQSRTSLKPFVYLFCYWLACWLAGSILLFRAEGLAFDWFDVAASVRGFAVVSSIMLFYFYQ